MADLSEDADLAQAVEAAERERGIAAVRSQLGRPGSDACEDCGREIPAARRSALPSATRCVGCQTLHEQPGGRRHG